MKVLPATKRLRPCRPFPRTRVTTEDERILEELALEKPRLTTLDIVTRFRERTGKPLYAETARRRVLNLRKAAGWSDGTEGESAPAEACPPGESPPCGDCGTRHGSILRGVDRPARRDGTRFGFAVRLCSQCYKRHAARVAREADTEAVPPCADCGDPEGFRRTHLARPTRHDGGAFGFAGKLCHDCYHEHRQSRETPPEVREQIEAEIRAAQAALADESRDPVLARQRKFAMLAQEVREQTRQARRAAV